MDAINILESLNDFSDNSDFNTKEWVNNCYKAMNDDFNTPILIANIFDAVKFINKVNQEKASISKEDWEVLLSSIIPFELNESPNSSSEQSIPSPSTPLMFFFSRVKSLPGI